MGELFVRQMNHSNYMIFVSNCTITR